MTTSSRYRRALKQAAAPVVRRVWNRARVVGWSVALAVSLAVWVVVAVLVIRAF